MTVRQLGKLSKKGEPVRALALTMIVNLAILAFVKTPVAILVAGNLGYIVAVTLAVAGFLLLRRDRPTWPRPIKLGRGWVPVACLLTVFNAAILVIGVSNPDLATGAYTEVAIGFILLFLGVVFYIYRRIVQDREKLRLRDSDDTSPVSEPQIRSGTPSAKARS